MRLIENWRSSYRWFSMWALGLLASLPAIWLAIPTVYQDWLPEKYRMVVLALLAVGGIAGRLIDQKGKSPDT